MVNMESFRPLEFYVTGHDFEKSILLSWDGHADLGTISVNIGYPICQRLVGISLILLKPIIALVYFPEKGDIKLMHLPLDLVLSYCIFSISVSYQYNQARHQRYFLIYGRYILRIIRLFAYSSVAFQYGFIIYYGYTREWHVALLLLIIGVVVDLSYNYIEEHFTKERFAVYLFLLSFVILPIFAYAIIVSLPPA